MPSEILIKPGQLLDEEHALIRTHPEVGYEILKNIQFPWPIAGIVRQHHERLDGTGYPHGLRGDAILREAKILAVADTVEAMANDRPYRKSPGIREALNEIERHKGTLFDPETVDCCQQLFARNQYQLPTGP